jgi:hypothetical protein
MKRDLSRNMGKGSHVPHPRRESIAELLVKENYTPEEVSELLEIDTHVIRRACWDGSLKAEIVDHHIVNIKRDDLLKWLDEWEHL